MFQARAAATGNARSPSVDRRVDGTMSVDVLADTEHLLQWSTEVSRRSRRCHTIYHADIDESEHTTGIERIRGASCDDALYKLTFTFTLLDPLRDFQPVKFTDKWS